LQRPRWSEPSSFSLVGWDHAYVISRNQLRDFIPSLD
jgi:hypothetical protein